MNVTLASNRLSSRTTDESVTFVFANFEAGV